MNKKMLIGLLCVIIGLFGCGKKVDEIDNKLNIDLYQHATVALSSIDENGIQTLYCTGFYVKPTIIVTARHCVVDESFKAFRELVFKNEVPESFKKELVDNTIGKNIDIVVYDHFKHSRITDSYPTDIFSATVIYVTADNYGDEFEPDDLALLQVDKAYSSSKFLEISDDRAMVGQTVYSLGMPKGIPWILSKGIVAAEHWYEGNYTHIFANILITPGLSGGSLVDENGKVLGIVTNCIKLGSEDHSQLSLNVVSSKIETYLKAIDQ